MLTVLQGSRGFLSHGRGVCSVSLFLKQTPGVQLRHGSSVFVVVALASPKGFGSGPSKSPLKPLSAEQEKNLTPEQKIRSEKDDEDDEIPEIVTNRMIKRIGVSIAVPVVLSVVSYLGFYSMKVNLKVDIPEWLPLLVSGLFLASSAFGILYGIISTSWDPVHDGSFWGLKEAQANWPAFFQNQEIKDERQ